MSHGADGFAEAGDFKTPSLDELLRISITLSDKEKLHEAALHDSPAVAMSGEDKKWLLEAMNGGDGDGPKNDAERMKQALVVVNDPAEPVNHKEYSLDLILFCIEDIDNALDFVKFDGGLATLLQLLASEQPSLRLGAAWLLGTLVQNNPKAQEAVFGTGCLPTLLGLVRCDSVVDVRRKAFLAVSSLVRGYSPASDSFIDSLSGFGVLCDTIAETDLQLQKRALFLAAHMLREEPTRVDLARKAGMISKAAAPLVAAAGDDELREFVLGLLVLLVDGNPAAAAEANEAGVGPGLVERKRVIGALEGDEREWAEEELRLCNQLSGLLA